MIIRILAVIVLLSTAMVPGSSRVQSIAARPLVRIDSPVNLILEAPPSYALAPIPLKDGN